MENIKKKQNKNEKKLIDQSDSLNINLDTNLNLETNHNLSKLNNDNNYISEESVFSDKSDLGVNDNLNLTNKDQTVGNDVFKDKFDTDETKEKITSQDKSLYGIKTEHIAINKVNSTKFSFNNNGKVNSTLTSSLQANIEIHLKVVDNLKKEIDSCKNEIVNIKNKNNHLKNDKSKVLKELEKVSLSYLINVNYFKEKTSAK
jgi:hypothetical protein